MTDELKTLTIPAAMQQWHTIPSLATARKYAAELKAQSDLIILLGHITPKEELSFLAEATEIPVLVTGHAHNGIPQPLMQDGRMLVRVKGYAEELGRLELKVDTLKEGARFLYLETPDRRFHQHRARRRRGRRRKTLGGRSQRARGSGDSPSPPAPSTSGKSRPSSSRPCAPRPAPISPS